MTTNNQITVWHLTDEESGAYSRQSFTVWSHKVVAESANSKNVTRDNKITVRIPTSSDIGVEIGDYVCFGIRRNSYPNRATDFKIASVSDNRIGANPHWKLVLE